MQYAHLLPDLLFSRDLLPAGIGSQYISARSISVIMHICNIFLSAYIFVYIEIKFRAKNALISPNAHAA
jgi:hypothetical protein